MVSSQGLRGRVHGALQLDRDRILFLGYCRSMRAISIHPRAVRQHRPVRLPPVRRRPTAWDWFQGMPGTSGTQPVGARSVSKQAGFFVKPQEQAARRARLVLGVEGVLLIIIPSNRLFRHSSGVLLFFSFPPSWSNETSTRKQSRGVAKIRPRWPACNAKTCGFSFPSFKFLLDAG